MMDYLPLRTTSTLSLWKKTVLRTFFSEIIEMNKKQNYKNTLYALFVLCLEETPLERLK